MAIITKDGWKICEPCASCPDFDQIIEPFDISIAMQNSRRNLGEREYFRQLRCGCYYEENKYGDIHGGYRCPYKYY